MAANNEVGTIYPIEKIAHVAQRYEVPFLCDASQAVGKIPIRFDDWGITLLSISAHKFYGPQGVGALVVRRGYPLEPLFYGGGHQKGLRSGTLNLPGIVGLGEACRLRSIEMETDEEEVRKKRDRLQTVASTENSQSCRQWRPGEPSCRKSPYFHTWNSQQCRHCQTAPSSWPFPLVQPAPQG
jgi:cysteine desulfurase